ncbi:MAG: hypothetical protein HY070_04620, partial [Chloroflexi bacterium]|nr:hypothetical protein [Chloroflexota bacterium]
GAERAYTELDQLARAKDRDVRQVAQDALEEWYLVNEEQRELDGDGLDEEFALEALPDIWNDELGTFSRN